jgi:hypothetical protein
MESKPHRTNSDFQLRYFMAGSCHTPDGAWMLMYGQKIIIESNLKNAEAQLLRREAKIDEAQFALTQTMSSWHKKLAAADIAEANADRSIWENNVKAAGDELATIEKLMAELEPKRKYSHLPMLEANEAAQREEWLGELKERAENFLLTMGTIPHDHFHHMRLHPDFEKELLPHIIAIADSVPGECLLGWTKHVLALPKPEAIS